MDDCPFRRQPVVRYLGRFTTPELVSCPTCGRTHLRGPNGDTEPFFEWCRRLDQALQAVHRPLQVALLGCEVNGFGEARGADVGVALGRDKGVIFRHGKLVRSVPLDQALDALLEEIGRTW